MSDSIQLFGGAFDGQVFDKPKHGSYVRIPIVTECRPCVLMPESAPVECAEYFINGYKTAGGMFKAVLTGIV